MQSDNVIHWRFFMYKFLKPNKDIRVACDSSADYFLHSHRHAEIHYVISGTFDVFTNNKWYHLKEKSLVFIFPYQIHTTKQASGLVYGTMFNVDLLPLFSQTLLNLTVANPYCRNQITFLSNHYLNMRLNYTKKCLIFITKRLLQRFP